MSVEIFDDMGMILILSKAISYVDHMKETDKLSFEKWYFGHYHGDWQTVIDGKHYEMLFEGIKEL